MQTITLGKARYTVKDTRVDFMSKLLACTGKPRKTRLKPVTRVFPSAGAIMTTEEYVADYYTLNQLGSHSHFAPLSTRLSVPSGEDSMEIEQ